VRIQIAIMTEQDSKDQALQEYRKKLLQHKEIDAKVRTLREQVKVSKKEYDKTEDDLKALQSVGQIIAEVLRQLDEERCKSLRWLTDSILVPRKASQCPRADKEVP